MSSWSFCAGAHGRCFSATVPANRKRVFKHYANDDEARRQLLQVANILLTRSGVEPYSAGGGS